jgi:hypothetical protein
MLAAAHPRTHLLRMMLSIHLLLPMHHLLIHPMLALTSACLVGSFVHFCLVSSNVLVVAMKVFSPAFIAGVLGATFFTMFFAAAHSCALTLALTPG